MVTKQEIQKTIDRLVGTKGNLNIPSWWMRKILSDLVKYCEDNELTSAIIKEYNKSQFNLVADKIEKLDAKLNNIGPHKLFEIVSELPVKPKDNIIYLVPSPKGEGNNVLTEWAWVNGSWEQFGEFGADVNLNDYATKEDLKSYATKDEAKPYDDSEIKQEIGLRNVGAVDADESVEEPEDKHATIEYVNNAIAAAITTTLNEEV